jgi:hypothetical protein
MIESLLLIADKFIVPQLKLTVEPLSKKASGALRAAGFFLTFAANPEYKERIKNGVGFDVYVRGGSLIIKEKEYKHDGRSSVSSSGVSVQ